MRFTRQLLGVLLGTLVLAAALLGAIAPASAHDAAESSSPAAGTTVPAPPEKVSVTFNRNPLALGSQIAVNDAAGNNWADGSVEIVDNVAAQKLKPGAPAGEFTVVWRVVSSDSHPIEGSFKFTATAAAAGAAAVPANPVPTLSTPQPGATVTPAEPRASEPFPWSIVIFVGTAVGLLVVLGLMAKRRLTDTDQPDTDQSDADAPATDAVRDGETGK